ncbi:MAG: 3-isopropylmalate dehydratase small subunit [Pseudomonadota bacterium]
MEPLSRIEARACPLPIAHLDTDQLIPARFMKRPRSEGYGQFLLKDLRASRAANLDDPRFAGAEILVAGPNAGCGSSREAAVYAVVDFGFRAVIAPSFGPIFHGNAVKNGLLPLALPKEVVEALLARIEADPTRMVRIDLEQQTIDLGDGAARPFEVDPFDRHCLLHGLDHIDLTLEHAKMIDAHERDLRASRPWTLPTTPRDEAP